MKKRKRAPGGGRKPMGDFSGLTSVMSFRMPDGMREQLEKSAKARSRALKRNVSLSQELLFRLRVSLNRDRDEARDPAMRALCFLFSQAAYAVHWNMPDWRSDPFLFRAVKLAIAKVLDALEPAGEIKLPDFWKVYRDNVAEEDSGGRSAKEWRDFKVKVTKSPDAMAEHAASSILLHFDSPRPLPEWVAQEEVPDDLDPDSQQIFRALQKHHENSHYGMEAARRDLGVKTLHKKSRGNTND